MYMVLMLVVSVAAFVLLAGIAYFTREKAVHDVRHEVRHSAATGHTPAQDQKRGLRS
jgi:hypothetical protein